MAKLRPEDVFTPATPVRDDMFATRRHEDLQDRVEAVLGERGRQVVLFGLTGVGKTSLIRYLCNQRKILYIRVECGGTFEEMAREALGRAVGEEEIERIKKTTGEAEFGATVWGFITGKVKVGQESEIRTAKVPRNIAALVAEAFALLDYRVLFLDNFENVLGKSHEKETTRAISEMLKLFSDRSIDAENDVKIVVAGIPTASEQLIRLDEATARRTAQIEVTRMPSEELDQILERGGEKLDLEFEGFARDQIVQYSDGFPYYTHLYGLHCARRAIKDGSAQVTIEHFEGALDSILADCDLALRRTYIDAAETSGEVRVRKTVMEAMASVNDLEVSFKTIREEFLKLHPGRYPSVEKLNFISPSMTKLKELNVLSDRDAPKSKNNQYRFTNPLMRGYVRLRIFKERQPTLTDV
ncbi:MAG: AAA family ATPase [Gaiellaceae bacterium]